MVAGMIASLVSLLIDRHSLYDRLKFQCIHELHHENIEEKGEDTLTVEPPGTEEEDTGTAEKKQPGQ